MTRFEKIMFALCIVFIIISFTAGFNYKNINYDIIFKDNEENSKTLTITDENENSSESKTGNDNISSSFQKEDNVQISGTLENNSEDDENNTAANKKIDLNTDNINALVSVPGIGEKTAEAIINYRKQNGNFKSVKDITNVKGIGEKKYEKFKNYFYVEGEK